MRASQVRAGLERDGWVVIHCVGSHFKLEKQGQRRTFSFHPNRDLGKSELEQIAKSFGYELDTLRRLL